MLVTPVFSDSRITDAAFASDIPSEHTYKLKEEFANNTHDNLTTLDKLQQMARLLVVEMTFYE